MTSVRRGETDKRKKVAAVARQYRRAGYDVLRPGAGGNQADFLEGYTPDLIATRNDDCVVIEVKRAGSLRSSNDLTEIAEAVSRQGGWRFELIVIPSDDDVEFISTEKVEELKSHGDRVYESGLQAAAYLFLTSILEELVGDLSLKHGLPARRLSTESLSRLLVTDGVIPAEVYEQIKAILSQRHRLAHVRSGDKPSRRDLETLIRLIDELKAAVGTRKAA